MFGGGQPVIVLNSNTKREQGKKVQLGNITAAKTVAGVIRSVNLKHFGTVDSCYSRVLIMYDRKVHSQDLFLVLAIMSWDLVLVESEEN